MMELVTASGSTSKASEDLTGKTALTVIDCDTDMCLDWQVQVQFNQDLIKGALDLSWTVHPQTASTGDPWADAGAIKASTTVIGGAGYVADFTGMISRA